jgi:protease II
MQEHDNALLCCVGPRYGSYEYSYDPSFSMNQLSLMDRGWLVGIAHIRGGGDMGRQWYEDGKYLKKKNTFTDFIAAAEHLIKVKGGVVRGGASAYHGRMVSMVNEEKGGVGVESEFFKLAASYIGSYSIYTGCGSSRGVKEVYRAGFKGR